MEDIIICECSSIDHQITFRTIEYIEEDLKRLSILPEELNEVYINIHLNKKPFWKRVKYAIKYIFGYKCNYGAFDEIIITKDKLKNVVNKL